MIDFTRRRFLFGLAAVPLVVPAVTHFVMPKLIGWLGDGHVLRSDFEAINAATARWAERERLRHAEPNLILAKFMPPGESITFRRPRPFA